MGPRSARSGLGERIPGQRRSTWVRLLLAALIAFGALPLTTIVGQAAATHWAFTTQPVAAASGAAFTAQPVIAAEDSTNTVVTSFPATTLTLTASGGTLSSCAGLTSSSGVVTVTGCTFAGLVGTNYTLTAAGGSITNATSNTFSPTTYGTASQTVFTTQPVAAASGAAFSTQPVIKVEDSGGNVVTNSSQDISLIPSGGTLSGCAGLIASSGVLTVTGCTFAGIVGTNYTLTAAGSLNFTNGVSSTFSPTTFGTPSRGPWNSGRSCAWSLRTVTICCGAGWSSADVHRGRAVSGPERPTGRRG